MSTNLRDLNKTFENGKTASGFIKRIKSLRLEETINKAIAENIANGFLRDAYDIHEAFPVKPLSKLEEERKRELMIGFQKYMSANISANMFNDTGERIADMRRIALDFGIDLDMSESLKKGIPEAIKDGEIEAAGCMVCSLGLTKKDLIVLLRAEQPKTPPKATKLEKFDLPQK